MILNFALWDVSPEIFPIGPLQVRWYGLLFALGFLIGQQILIRIYKREGKSEKDVETLTIYMVIATIVGARLGHVFFYDWAEYKNNLIKILYIWEGGLASHGAAIGILIAIYLYSKKATHQSYFYVLDRLVITIAFAGCLIRLGNLMNSEIIGKPTNAPTAFLFVSDTKRLIEEKASRIVYNVDIKETGKKIPDYDLGINLAEVNIRMDIKKNKLNNDPAAYISRLIEDTISKYSLVAENMVFLKPVSTEIKYNKDGTATAVVQAGAIPRHPAQLYEAFSSFLLFLLLLYVYNRKKGKTPEGRIFGLFVVILFSLRFLYEFNKENQVDFESGMIAELGINMGQLLSIPFILAGIFILMRSFRKKNEVI
jgi:prolipoprotein diacylglyceryltransferase